MNNNSSRFGKYLELMFEATDGSICGASMSHYLLEKSRVTVRNDKEQNFHIFYQLYAGLAASGTLADHGLSVPSKNNYLNNPPGPPDASVLDGTLETCGDGLASEWQEVITGMAFIGVEGAPMVSLTNLLAGIIVAGDIKFKEGASDQSQVSNPDKVTQVAKLLGVDAAVLSKSFTVTTLKIGNDTQDKFLNVEEASSNRDAMAKMVRLLLRCACMHEKARWTVHHCLHLRLVRVCHPLNRFGVSTLADFQQDLCVGLRVVQRDSRRSKIGQQGDVHHRCP
jgi:myosin heavy subunit